MAIMFYRRHLISLLATILLVSCSKKIEKTEIVEKWSDGTQKTVHEYFSLNDSSYRETEFYKSGKLKSKYYYKDGKIDGLALGLFESGDTAQITHFKKGVKNGLEKTWYESGELWSRYIFKDGKKISGNHFFRNGQATAQLKFKNGLVVWGEYYHPNGEIRSTGSINLNKKVGDWEYYYENGNIKEFGRYVNGKEAGVWEYYHKNGNLKEMGEYKNGKKTGVWQEFDEEGNLIHDIYF
jgi:antitoxin component YwqK of YwqJK toxin-antitoxin module